MKIRLPQYSGRDYLVFSVFVLPFTVILNAVIFGSRLFSGLSFFLLASLITASIFTIEFLLCGNIAVNLKKRFPREEQSGRKMALMIFFFLVLTGLFLVMLFRIYESIPLFEYTFNENIFAWAYLGLGIANIFLTFLFEGIARFERWKVNMKETDALKKVYRQSRLLSLRNQVNPHFLFNSLNSLSSLIQEDSEKGERFLDELSRVYRYMLHNDEEQLVTLETELKFLESYVYILQVRHTEGLKVEINIDPEDKKRFLPPLALQTIVEHIVTQNSICKDIPLHIRIDTTGEEVLVVQYNILPKLAVEVQEPELGLDNLVQKYLLLNQSRLEFKLIGDNGIVYLPLIDSKAEVMI